MKNKWHDEIRKRLRKYRKECLECLYPDEDYEWGGSRKNIHNTINLVNKIMKGIPVEAWPKPNDDMTRTTVADGNWSIRLGWSDGKRRTADLKHKNNDHTAWLIESPKKDGTYINLDIGGS